MFGMIIRKVVADYSKVLFSIALKLVADVVVLTCNYLATRYCGQNAITQTV